MIENVKEHKNSKFSQNGVGPRHSVLCRNTYYHEQRLHRRHFVCDGPSAAAHSQREGLRLLSDQVSTVLEYTAVKPPAGFKESAAQEPSTRRVLLFFGVNSFTDFVGFTTISEDVDPGELVASLDEFFSMFDQMCQT